MFNHLVRKRFRLFKRAMVDDGWCQAPFQSCPKKRCLFSTHYKLELFSEIQSLFHCSYNCFKCLVTLKRLK